MKYIAFLVGLFCPCIVWSSDVSPLSFGASAKVEPQAFVLRAKPLTDVTYRLASDKPEVLLDRLPQTLALGAELTLAPGAHAVVVLPRGQVTLSADEERRAFRLTELHEQMSVPQEGDLYRTIEKEFARMGRVASMPASSKRHGSGMGWGGFSGAFKGAQGIAKLGRWQQTPAEERKLGDAMAMEIARRFGGLEENAPALARLQEIGLRLADNAPRPVLEWRFRLLASDKVESFSVPGGQVFVTRGLYQLAEEDDMLAAILGHEIWHVIAKDALKALGAVPQKARSGTSTEAGLRTLSTEYEVAISKIVNRLSEIGFDPVTEYEADAEGRRLAISAGFSGDGLSRLLARASGESKLTTFAAHPPSLERIKRLRARRDGLPQALLSPEDLHAKLASIGSEIEPALYHLQRASILRENGRLKEALEEYRQAMATGKDDYPWLADLEKDLRLLLEFYD